MGQAERVDNPAPFAEYCDTPIDGRLWVMRQALYENNYLAGSGIGIAVLHAMVMVNGMVGKNRLYITLGELLNGKVNRYWGRSYKSLHEAFSNMEKRGFMVRAYRDKKIGSGKIVLWGLSGKGKVFLQSYYDYLEGKHDGELFG